ncbi:MAG TPA: GNAT family N-acetyltransferase [Phototrophicaceae bacterium]|nr:GNAT family N-acetyltransferase [Phototrophicaceae bacterium]
MSATLSFVIRDGLESDILGCLRLDHSYETDYVWQVQVSDEDGRRIDLKPEHLPRPVSVDYPVEEARFHPVLRADQCFLVATTRDDEPEVIAYLTMHADPLYRLGVVKDLVVSRPYRRQKIGTRLLKIAAVWAKEHQLTSVMIETQTKNFPSIRFCEAAGFVFCGYNDRYFPNRDIAVFFSQSVR